MGGGPSIPKPPPPPPPPAVSKAAPIESSAPEIGAPSTKARSGTTIEKARRRPTQSAPSLVSLSSGSGGETTEPSILGD